MFKPLLMAAQPWLKQSPSESPNPRQPPVSGGINIIDAFNETHDVHTLLQRHGYERKSDGRYLSPHSSTGTPGIIILKREDGVERIFCHHASDPLTSDHSHDAFSLYTILEHGGDNKKAVRAAADALSSSSREYARSVPKKTVTATLDPEPLEEKPWADLKPLPGLYPPVPPLPPELIPAPLRPWLGDIAERASLPLEFVTCPALVALSAVVGRKVGIRPKRLDDWLVVPNLWGGIVGSPGVMKSAAISEPTRPLKSLVKRAQERYEEASTRAEAERVRLELEIAVLKEQEKRAAKDRYKSE